MALGKRRLKQDELFLPACKMFSERRSGARMAVAQTGRRVTRSHVNKTTKLMKKNQTEPPELLPLADIRMGLAISVLLFAAEAAGMPSPESAKIYKALVERFASMDADFPATLVAELQRALSLNENEEYRFRWHPSDKQRNQEKR